MPCSIMLPLAVFSPRPNRPGNAGSSSLERTQRVPVPRHLPVLVVRSPSGRRWPGAWWSLGDCDLL